MQATNSKPLARRKRGHLREHPDSARRRTRSQNPVLERHVIGELGLLTIAASLAGRRRPAITLFTLSRTKKGDLVRDDLHDLMLRSRSILVLAGLDAPLDGYKPAAVEVVRASFRQTVESDYWKPGDLFPLLAVC